MSVVTQSTSKGEKSKKFQSLDINNIYQGSATKPQQKTIPQKHGLQSLGKIPTARKAPANLPSLKAENHGNDPTIAIVPAGSSGWAGKDEKAAVEKGSSSSNNGQAKPEQGTPTEQNQNLTNNFHQQINNPPQQQPQRGTGGPTQPKTWRNVTQTGTRAAQVAASHARQNLLSHRSPLFGQEFPTLSSSAQASATTDQEGQSSNSVGSGNKHDGSPSADVTAQKLKEQTSQLIGSTDSQKYGPGPNLRPQTFGNWSLGGGSKLSNNEQASLNAQHSSQANQPTSDGNVNVSGPPGLVSANNIDTAAAIAVNRAQQIQREIAANQFKFDVSPKSPLVPHTNLIRKPITSEGGLKKSLTPQLQPNSRGGGRFGNSGKNEYRNNKVDNTVFQQSIIDNEKLKRMDDFDRELNEDDWARSDETFDYNKKIASDDEDEHGKRAYPDWADQIKPSIRPLDKRIPLHITSASSNNYEQSHTHSQSHRTRPLSSEISFLDEEEQRRAKKNEEVLKNIERARRRREEEEQKYKGSQPLEFSSQPPYGRNLNEEAKGGRDGTYYGRNHSARPLNDRRSPGSYRSNHNNDRNSRDDNDNRSNSNTRPTFGKFDVLGGHPNQQQPNDHDKQASNSAYEEQTHSSSDRKHQTQSQIQILQPHQQPQYDSGGGGTYAPRKQVQQQSSVPPRFKRNVGELHAFKRSSPPKETVSSIPSSAEIDSTSNDGGDKEASPSSLRSQSSKEKDFGSLFRSSSGASSNRKSPGNWDRHSNHSNTGSTMGGGTDKEDTDKNSTSSKDEYRKDNVLQLSSTNNAAGRSAGTEFNKETMALANSHGGKDNNFASPDLSSSRLSQERSSAERMSYSSHADMPRPSYGSSGNSEHYDESRLQRDSRVRPSGEISHNYEEGKLEQSYNMTGRAGASNVSDRREHQHHQLAGQGRFDRYDTDNRDRRDRNIKLGKSQTDDFRDRRDREYDRIDRNKDKVDRDTRSSRGGRPNRDTRGILGSRSESNVPGSLTKPLQVSTHSGQQQKKIVLPTKASQGRNQQLTEEVSQEPTLSRPKHTSGDFDSSKNIKEIDTKMKNLTTLQMEGAPILQQQEAPNVPLGSASSEMANNEMLQTKTLLTSESAPNITETLEPVIDLATGEGAGIANLTDQQNSGWFAPRGQPSRRGRGGLSSAAGSTRSFTRSDQDTVVSGVSGSMETPLTTTATSNTQGRASLPRTGEDEWESTSDRSYEENAKRSQGQPPIEDKYHDRTKEQQREKGALRDIRRPDRDDRYRKPEGTSESHILDNGACGDNRRRNDRDDARRGKYDMRGGMDRSGDKRGVIMDRTNIKQPNYDTRRQKQLPPRLAKQKEASRVLGGLTNAAMDGSGWGAGEAILDGSNYQTWDQNLHQQSSQMPQSQLPQQPNQQRSNHLMAGEYDPHSLIHQSRYGESGTPSIQASGDNLHSSTGVSGTNESQHGRNSAPPVQTIIFENTNFKGRATTGAPVTMTSGTTSVNDKMVFTSSVHSTSSGVGGDLKPDAIHMPPMGGFGTNKNEDSDLKLDFTFEADMTHNVGVEVVENKSGSIVGAGNAPRHTSGHHPTEDLNMKIASVKKVWETLPSMSPVSHSDAVPNTTFNQGFATSGNNDDKAYGQTASTSEVGLDPDSSIQSVPTGTGGTGGSATAYGALAEKSEGVTTNVAKVRPQQVQQQHQASNLHPGQGPHQQHQQAASAHLMMQQHHQAQVQSNQQVLEERVAAIARSSAAAAVGPNSGNTANGSAGNRFTGAAALSIGSGGLQTLQSQSILNQPPSLYQAFQMDHAGRGGMTTNPLYSAYAGLGGQSVLLPSSGLSAGNAGNMFGASAAGNQFRLQEAGNAAQFATPTQQSSGNAVLLSQSSLISSAMKQSNQIGPIGTKGGNGPFQQSGIGTLPVSGTSPLHLIQSDGQGYINYMTPNAMQRSAAAQGPGQTAFYQALAASTQQQQQQQQVVSRQQAVAQQQAAAAFSNVQGFTNQQGLTAQQQQLNQQAAQLRNQAAVAAAAGAPPPNVTGIPYSRDQQVAAVAAAAAAMKQAQGGIARTDSFGSGHTNNSNVHGNTSMGGPTHLNQLQGHQFQQHPSQTKVSLTNSQMTNISSLGNVAGGHSNGPAGPTYSPTPIQRPHANQGKQLNDEDPMVPSVVESGSLKDKKQNEEN